ncbi:uncharacterized protein ACO6RY_03296 [Pungitius sinensis]
MSVSRQQSNNKLVKWERKKSKNNNAGPRSVHYGLYNQGATCYLNSVLQVLSMTTEIQDRLESKSQTTDNELKTLFKDLKKGTCGTEKITEILEVENVHLQGDAADCLVTILRKISPQASEVFKGERTDTIKCCKGHTINEEIDPFWYLSLALEDTDDSSHSVERGFERIFRSRVLDGDTVHCGGCGEETKATCESTMVSYPQILSLLIQRFIFDNNTKAHFKSSRRVDVPRKLQRDHKKYEVYAVVSHVGSLQGGHYTASVRSDGDGAWYEFNDANVHKIKEQPFAESETYSSSTAYLLMYREAETNRDQVVVTIDEDAIQNVPPQRTEAPTPGRGGRDGKSSRKLAKCPPCRVTPLWISVIVVVFVLVLVLVVVLSVVCSRGSC